MAAPSGDATSFSRTAIADLMTVAALVALGRDAQLPGHLRRALDNGLTRDQLAEAITHLAFYAGWPAAMSAVSVLATVIGQDEK